MKIEEESFIVAVSRETHIFWYLLFACLIPIFLSQEQCGDHINAYFIF